MERLDIDDDIVYYLKDVKNIKINLIEIEREFNSIYEFDEHIVNFIDNDIDLLDLNNEDKFEISFTLYGKVFNTQGFIEMFTEKEIAVNLINLLMYSCIINN
jgi:hypothetical protein